jgi:hypothetical protein
MKTVLVQSWMLSVPPQSGLPEGGRRRYTVVQDEGGCVRGGVGDSLAGPTGCTDRAKALRLGCSLESTRHAHSQPAAWACRPRRGGGSDELRE